MINIQEILIQIVQTGAIVTGAAFVLKKYLELIFSKDLEKFKADLEKSSIEFKIRYEKLHTERAEVIKTLYQKIARTYTSFSILTCPIQFDTSEEAEKQRMVNAFKEVSEMTAFYNENRIFFEESLAQEIDRLMALFHDCRRSYQISNGLRKEDPKTSMKECFSAWDKLTKDELPAIKKRIENEFRSLIGINENNDKK